MAISIPDSVKLKRNKTAEKLLLDKSREWLDKQERTDGWHASDILNPRKAFFQRLLNTPTEDRKIPIFLVGKVLHAFVLGAMAEGVDLGKTDEGSSFSQELGIWYSPDWDKGDIAEFKTSRAFKEPESIDDVSSYVEQLLIYMAAKDRTDAELWVLYLNLKDAKRRTSPEFRAYRVSIAPSDLPSLKEQIGFTREALDRAVITGDHTPLPLCWKFICSPDHCSFWDRCKPEGRWQEPTH